MSFDDDYKDKKLVNLPDDREDSPFPTRSRNLAICELVEDELVFMPNNAVLVNAKENLRRKYESLDDIALFNLRDKTIADDYFDEDEGESPF